MNLNFSNDWWIYYWSYLVLDFQKITRNGNRSIGRNHDLQIDKIFSWCQAYWDWVCNWVYDLYFMELYIYWFFHLVLERCYMWGLKILIFGRWILNVLISLVNFILMSDENFIGGRIEWIILCCYMWILWKYFRENYSTKESAETIKVV